MGKTIEELRKKAIKLLKKKMEGDEEPSEKKILKKIAKLQAKEAAKGGGSDAEESPKKRAAEEEEEETSSKKAKTEEPAAAAAPAAGGSTAGAVGPPWKCFLGNLSYDIDDDQCKDFFKDCGTVTDLFWLQDKETQKFFGAGFVTFDTPEGQVAAVAKNGEELLGRPIKIEFAKPKAGGNDRTPKKTFEKKEMSEKPEGCVQIFCGNLSYDIDDDATKKFFTDGGCGEIKAIRWLTDRESGDFKGCGFIEFYEESSVDAAAKLNGGDLLGRQIRIDYAKQREKSW